MKKRDKYIENEVEKTLEAFEGVERAKPKPFLFTRLQARLEEKRKGVVKAGFLSPAFKRITVALIILVVAFNIYTATRFIINPTATDTLSNSEQLFVEEYYPSTPTLYNISQMTTNP